MSKQKNGHRNQGQARNRGIRAFWWETFTSHLTWHEERLAVLAATLAAELRYRDAATGGTSGLNRLHAIGTCASNRETTTKEWISRVVRRSKRTIRGRSLTGNVRRRDILQDPMVRWPSRQQISPPLGRIIVGRLTEIVVAVAVLAGRRRIVRQLRCRCGHRGRGQSCRRGSTTTAAVSVRHRLRFDLHLYAAAGCRVDDGVVGGRFAHVDDATAADAARFGVGRQLQRLLQIGGRLDDRRLVRLYDGLSLGPVSKVQRRLWKR